MQSSSSSADCQQFQPQHFRPNVCLNCFAVKANHSSAALESKISAAPAPIAKPSMITIPRAPAAAQVVSSGAIRPAAVPSPRPPAPIPAPAPAAAPAPVSTPVSIRPTATHGAIIAAATVPLAPPAAPVSSLPAPPMSAFESKRDMSDEEHGSDMLESGNSSQDDDVAMWNNSSASNSEGEDDNDEEDNGTVAGESKTSSGAPAPPPLEPSSALANAALSHDQMLAGIRAGVALRSVARPARPPAEVTASADLSSALHWYLKKKKRQTQEALQQLTAESSERVDDLGARITRLRDLIRYEDAKRLVIEVAALQSELKLASNYLENREHWPVDKYETLRAEVAAIERLEQAIVHAERFASGEGLSDWVILDAPIAKRVLQGVIKAWREAPQARAGAEYHFELDDLLRRAAVVGTLVDSLLVKSLQAYKDVLSSETLRYDKSAKAVKAYQILCMCLEFSREIETVRISVLTDEEKNRQLQAIEMKERLEKEFAPKIAVAERKGNWDAKQTVQLRSTADSGTRPGPRKESVLILSPAAEKAKQLLLSDASSPESLQSFSELVSGNDLSAAQLTFLAHLAIQHKNLEAFKCLVSAAQQHHARDPSIVEWLHETVAKNWPAAVTYLLDEAKYDVNARQDNGGHTPLHVACRLGNVPIMIELLQKGANPRLVNALNRTPLQQVAIKIPAIAESTAEEGSQPLPFASYLNNSDLSDVTLVLDSGDRFPAHRLILSAQSSVFKAMFRTDGRWQENDSKEVLLSDISLPTMRHLLKYLYTGDMTLVRDDLNTGVGILAVASRFMLDRLRDHVQRVLATRVSAENVVALWNVATLAQAYDMLAVCRHFILVNYEKIVDPDHVVLFQVLDTIRTMTHAPHSRGSIATATGSHKSSSSSRNAAGSTDRERAEEDYGGL